MFRLTNYIKKLKNAYNKSGLHGALRVLTGSYYYRFFFPILFIKLRGKLKNLPRSVPAGSISLLSLSITSNKSAKWVYRHFRWAAWLLVIETRMKNNRNQKWSIINELEDFPGSRFPVIKNIPFQFPETQGNFIIEIFIKTDFRLLRDSKWRIARILIPIKSEVKEKQ